MKRRWARGGGERGSRGGGGQGERGGQNQDEDGEEGERPAGWIHRKRPRQSNIDPLPRQNNKNKRKNKKTRWNQPQSQSGGQQQVTVRNNSNPAQGINGPVPGQQWNQAPNWVGWGQPQQWAMPMPMPMPHHVNQQGTAFFFGGYHTVGPGGDHVQQQPGFGQWNGVQNNGTANFADDDFFQGTQFGGPANNRNQPLQSLLGPPPPRPRNQNMNLNGTVPFPANARSSLAAPPAWNYSPSRISGSIFKAAFKNQEGGRDDEEDEDEEVAIVPKGQSVDHNLCLKDPMLPSEMRVQAFLDLCQGLDDNPQPSTANHDDDTRTKLSKELLNLFLKRRQSSRTFRRKVDYWLAIDRALRSRWPRCRTLAFGSTLSGFGTNSSDMDLCVFYDYLSPEEGAKMSKKGRQKGSVEFLVEIRRTLKQRQLSSNDVRLIPATVAILKFDNRQHDLAVDLSTNSPAGALNTHLLYCYSQLDWRVRPLVLSIKCWAKEMDINDASVCTLSSYVISLLVINYLQCGVSPPVVPSLQQLYPRMFSGDETSDIFTLPYLTKLPEYNSENNSSLGELFVGFFEYVADRLDFSNDVPSVRTGRLLTNRSCERFARRHGMPPRQWTAYVCVEEPFDRTNAARAVVQRTPFDTILGEFRNTREELRNKEMPLSDLMGW